MPRVSNARLIAESLDSTKNVSSGRIGAKVTKGKASYIPTHKITTHRANDCSIMLSQRLSTGFIVGTFSVDDSIVDTLEGFPHEVQTLIDSWIDYANEYQN